MKEEIFKILSNSPVSKDVFRMVLSGNTGEIQACGQFVNIKLDGLYLRRPISVHDVCDACDGSNAGSAAETVSAISSAETASMSSTAGTSGTASTSGMSGTSSTMTLLYKVLGKGTRQMSNLKPGTELNILVGLGNGFDLSISGEKPLLIGGGIGLAPMFWTAKCLAKQGKKPTVILGFKTKDECYCQEEFQKLGCDVITTTEDGTYGVKGFVTNAIPQEYSHVYACGPEPMLKAVFYATKGGAQFSFEERMGCGFGACMGCSCKTVTGYKRICKDGPVLQREEILWDKQ